MSSIALMLGYLVMFCIGIVALIYMALFVNLAIAVIAWRISGGK